jgi:hypothetical protein
MVSIGAEHSGLFIFLSEAQPYVRPCFALIVRLADWVVMNGHRNFSVPRWAILATRDYGGYNIHQWCD